LIDGRRRIFRKNAEFEAFEAILAEGLERVDMRICGYCIMSNHWHLLLWPRDDGVTGRLKIGQLGAPQNRPPDIEAYSCWFHFSQVQSYFR